MASTCFACSFAPLSSLPCQNSHKRAEYFAQRFELNQPAPPAVKHAIEIEMRAGVLEQGKTEGEGLVVGCRGRVGAVVLKMQAHEPDATARQVILAREMRIEGGSAAACGRTDVLDADRLIAFAMMSDRKASCSAARERAARVSIDASRTWPASASSCAWRGT